MPTVPVAPAAPVPVPGKQPTITVAQIIAGIPVLARLGEAFGIYSLSPAEQDALSQAVQYAFVLIGGDAVIRVGRNIGHGLAQK